MEANKTVPKTGKVKKKKPSVFNKVTHLYLQEKHLTAIPKLSAGTYDLQTLYLYGNAITKIENLDGSFCNLTSLYIQNNKITKMENLYNLRKLKKLYIGKNEIAVLEGLECVEALEELHIEKQELADNVPLCFDPRTIASLTMSLTILNISHNNITSLSFLAPLKLLVNLDASHNDLDDVKEVGQVLSNWMYLKEAKFIGNPISKLRHYRENIIAHTNCLETLDNKDITDVSRSFIKRFEEGKLTCSSKQHIKEISELFKDYSRLSHLRQAALDALTKDFKSRKSNELTAFSDTETDYQSWNQLPKRKPLTKPSSSSNTLRGHKMESHRNILVSKTTIKFRKS